MINQTNNFKYLWDENNPLGYKNMMGLYKTKKELLFIKKSLEKERMRILDIGGGSGRLALPLIKLGHDVTIIDINKEATSLAKKRGILKSYCVSLHDYLEYNFDLALAIELFSVSKPLDVIQDAYRILKKNGTLIFVGVNTDSWRFKLHQLKKKRSPSYHISLDEYINLINENGFKLERIEGFMWIPFRVNSNSILVIFFSMIEQIFNLNLRLRQSPWLLFSCRKVE